MDKKRLERLAEQAQIITDQLNLLTYNNVEEDSVFMDYIQKLEEIYAELSGEVNTNSSKTEVYRH